MAPEDDIATLTVLAHGMLADLGDQTGLDARARLDRWLTGVVPALGNHRPMDVLNESDGFEVVKSLLSRAQFAPRNLIRRRDKHCGGTAVWVKPLSQGKMNRSNFGRKE